MEKEKLSGKWALVTGASSGLGVDFARELASYQSNLVLVARRKNRLQEVKTQLQERYAVEIKVIPFDLSSDQAAEGLSQKIADEGIKIDVLINNAGFGLYGEFLENDLKVEQDMVQVNIRALMGLTKLFAREMKQRGFGYILLVASNSAYQPSPGYTVYGATKSFVLSFGEALNYELKDSPVSVTVISPGPTRTEFHDVTGQGRDNLYIKLVTMESEQVARIGIRAMLQGKLSVVPGFINAVNAWLAQRMPRRWALTVAAWMMGV